MAAGCLFHLWLFLRERSYAAFIIDGAGKKKLALIWRQTEVLVKSFFSLVCTILLYAIFKKEEC
jgi:hypothetical protein